MTSCSGEFTVFSNAPERKGFHLRGTCFIKRPGITQRNRIPDGHELYIDEAYLNLGLICRMQGRLEEAAAFFARALEIDPDYKSAKDALDDVEEALFYQASKTTA